MESFSGVKGWKHDHKRITVVVEGPRRSRDNYRVVKRQGGGAVTIARRDTQEKAIDKAVKWMRNHPMEEEKKSSQSGSRRF